MSMKEVENMANEKLEVGDRGDSKGNLYIDDFVAVLRDLSKVFERPNVGNPELSRAFSKLACILVKHKGKLADDVLDSLRLQKKKHSEKLRFKKAVSISPLEAKTFTLQDIEKVIETENLSKSDLVNIGVGRFGMSKADLTKTKKERIVETLQTAIANVRTIDIIGKAAGEEQDRLLVRGEVTYGSEKTR